MDANAMMMVPATGAHKPEVSTSRSRRGGKCPII